MTCVLQVNTIIQIEYLDFAPAMTMPIERKERWMPDEEMIEVAKCLSFDSFVDFLESDSSDGCQAGLKHVVFHRP